MIAGNPPELGYRTKRWTLEEYRKFVEVGAIDASSRVEFVEGEIIEKMGQNLPHIDTIGELAEGLRALFGPSFHVREGRPVQIEQSEPEPDLSVIRGRPRDIRGRHPRIDEIALLVEVSDSTLPFDLNRKAALYARGGIAEYWIANVQARTLIVHRGSRPEGGWDEIRTYGPETRVRPLSAEGDLLVGDLLPPEEPVSA